MRRFWLQALLLAAVVVAAWVILRPYFGETEPPPQPLAVASGESEVAWLMPATSAAAWERFVTGVGRAAARLHQNWPEIEVDSKRAYPPSSTDVPEIALVWGQSGQRLCFRWYKLTSRWKADPWVAALLRDRPAPLAFIGGSNSEAASVLAQALQKQTQNLPEDQRPLLLLTTATADRVSLEQNFGSPVADKDRVELTRIYPDRTFRFCFTNNQMADAVSRFICTQPDLRPEGDQVYLVQWNDDSYSYDLSDCFLRALSGLAKEGSLTDWAFPRLWQVDSSVGSFYAPNRFETEVAQDLSRKLARPRAGTGGADQAAGRALLVVTGQVQPTRRFLRGLERLDPGRTHRLVVATGDAISFNTVYRDRRSTWAIQDLPMALVFFCHYNPVERRAGFRPTPEGIAPLLVSALGQLAGAPSPWQTAWTAETMLKETGDDDPAASTGTEDVLLNADIVRSLARAFLHDEQPCRNAAELGERLRHTRLDPKGQPLFAADGNRRSGTGEHVVCLRPVLDNGRVLPQARLEVWRWLPSRTADDPGPTWEARDAPLFLFYDPPTVERGVHR